MASSSLSILIPTSSFPSKPSKRSSVFTNPYPNLKVLCSFSSYESGDFSVEKYQRTRSGSDFVRFKRGSVGGTGELQTAVVSYKKRFPWSPHQPFFQVDLVSTIHFADKEYFEILQKELESYDCVLYEMLTNRENLENRREPGAARMHKSSYSPEHSILGFIRGLASRVLALDFQLEHLDYDRDHWRHADLDLETLELLQFEKGESIFTVAYDMSHEPMEAVIRSLAVPEDLNPWRSKLLWASRVLPMPRVCLFIIIGLCMDPGDRALEYPEFEAFLRLDLSAAIKIHLARRITTKFPVLSPDVEENSVIIGERNKAAIKALKRSISDGHNKIAILYGGTHMPNLGRRLQDDFDLVPSGLRWVTAWSIENSVLDSSSTPFLRAIAKALRWPLNRNQTIALLVFSSALALDLWFWKLFWGTVLNWISKAASMFFRFFLSAKKVMWRS